MNPKSKKYAAFSLVHEMMETADVVRTFDQKLVTPFVKEAKSAGRIFFTGEGSSRIFPAKNAMAKAQEWGMGMPLSTDGGRQALEYILNDHAVFGASNSGKTRELIELFRKLRAKKHTRLFGLTATPESPLETITKKTHVLACGKEEAVAATKSVVEQALFYHALLAGIAGRRSEMRNLSTAGAAIKKALTAAIPPAIVKACAKAERIYFAGRNNGVAEELTLKTNEITRKPSAFLEGTYAVHGIEEVMNKNEVVVVIDPFEAEVEKFRDCLAKGVGMTVIAIAKKKIPAFPTIVIPTCKNFDTYVQLAAGWNLLVDIGIANGVQLDKTERARKVGNEAK